MTTRRSSLGSRRRVTNPFFSMRLSIGESEPRSISKRRGQLADAHLVALPEHDENQVLRIGDVQLLQERHEEARHVVARGVERKAQVLVQLGQLFQWCAGGRLGLLLIGLCAKDRPQPTRARAVCQRGPRWRGTLRRRSPDSGRRWLVRRPAR